MRESRKVRVVLEIPADRDPRPLISELELWLCRHGALVWSWHAEVRVNAVRQMLAKHRGQRA